MQKMIRVLAMGVLALPLVTLRAEDEKPKEDDAGEQIQQKFQEAIQGIQIFGGGNGQFQFRGGGLQISKRTVNGVTTIDATENGKKTKITEDPEKGITVATTKTYDRSNADELKDKNPAVFQYLKKSPQGMGAVKFNFKVDVTSSVTAKDADELKNDHPEAHKLYERYSKGRGANVIQFNVAPGFGGAFPNQFKMPNFRIQRDLKQFEGQIKKIEERLQKQLERFPRGIEKAKPPQEKPEPKKPGIAT